MGRFEEVEAEQSQSLVQRYAPFVDCDITTQFKPLPLLLSDKLNLGLEVDPDSEIPQFIVLVEKLSLFNDGASDS